MVRRPPVHRLRPAGRTPKFTFSKVTAIVIVFERFSWHCAFGWPVLVTWKSGCGRNRAGARVWATFYPLPNFGWTDFALCKFGSDETGRQTRAPARFRPHPDFQVTKTGHPNAQCHENRSKSSTITVTFENLHLGARPAGR